MEKQPPSPAAELCLRFQAACGHPVVLPTRRLSAGAGKCPRCAAAVEFPPLGPQVRGLETVLQECGQVLDTSCPNCGKSLRIALSGYGKCRACPNCQERLTLKLVVGEHSPPPQPVVSAAVDNGRSRPSRPEPRRRSREVPQAAVESLPLANIEEERDVPRPQLYAGSPPNEAAGRPGRRSGNCASPRLLYRSVFWGLQLGGPLSLLIGAASLQKPVLLLVLLLFFLPIQLSRRLTDAIVSALVQSFPCPGCGTEYDAVNRWKCACGYGDHTERHVLHFRCRLCGSRIGHIHCERCAATILVR